MPRRARRDIFADAKVILCRWHSNIIFARTLAKRISPDEVEYYCTAYHSPHGEYNWKKRLQNTIAFFMAFVSEKKLVKNRGFFQKTSIIVDIIPSTCDMPNNPISIINIDDKIIIPFLFRFFDCEIAFINSKIISIVNNTKANSTWSFWFKVSTKI